MIAKSLYFNKETDFSGYPHREHRSKKGRKTIPRYASYIRYKRKLQELKEQEFNVIYY